MERTIFIKREECPICGYYTFEDGLGLSSKYVISAKKGEKELK